ncbi:hypothetical protein LOK49_LG07G01096 [Camellia lanceoleosa]|uniref:Uncharacterized protein n=1 Tax=Camellia lanceoleosa TaxID=1840588 RepID=A0ACC0GYM9_9ERIC|nr:hypothetical protein LOK49_LG07G01096 [Camellia lanceoleosa]
MPKDKDHILDNDDLHDTTHFKSSIELSFNGESRGSGGGDFGSDQCWDWTLSFPSLAALFFRIYITCNFGKMSYNTFPTRWKEQYFVNVGTDCGLTIAGFYYVCFSCSGCSINGFYYNPNSSPFQKLELKSTHEGRSVVAA